MISPFANDFLFSFEPVTPELFIYISNTLSSFYKCKTNFYPIYFHVTNFFPINCSLVLAYVNAMDCITLRNFYLKAGIKYICWSNEKINCVIHSNTGQGKPKKYFEDIF